MSIKQKLNSGVYKITGAPRILYMENGVIFVNKNGTNPDEINSFENFDWERDSLRIYKLNAASYGDWNLSIKKLHVNHFDSRDKLDSMFFDDCKAMCKEEVCYEKISLKKAMKLLDVTISINMNYYRGNVDTMEKDLNRTLDRADLYDKSKMKKIESVLFYNQWLKVFDVEGGDEDLKRIMFSKFKVLRETANGFVLATARRGNYYFIFTYDTS